MTIKNTLRKVHRFVRVLRKQDFFERKDINVPLMHLGSEYGGWTIAADRLNSESVVLSAGVGEDISFDLALYNSIGCNIVLFDPTPKSIQWFKNQRVPAEITLKEYGLGGRDEQIDMHLPANENYVSGTVYNNESTYYKNTVTVDLKTLKSIMQELAVDEIDLLKLDVEGAEYDVIDRMLQDHVRPQQLLVEFHHRFPFVGIDKSRDCIRKLRDVGYRLFRVSDSGEEFSFIYNDIHTNRYTYAQTVERLDQISKYN